MTALKNINVSAAETFKPNIDGVFLDLPEAVYRQADGVNISSLKIMGRSPAHYYARINAPAITPTPAMVFGTLLHRAVLEPEKLAGSFAVKPSDMDFRSKDGKAWRDSQTLPIIDEDQATDLDAAANKVMAHKYASSILANTEKEVSVFKWRNLGGDLLLKGRLDAVAEDENGYTTIIDIKTTEDASQSAFAKSIANFGYAEQAAYYMDLIGASFFIFIAVEKTAPYEIGVYCLDNDSIDHGRAINNRNLDTLENCLKTNEWAGYSDSLQTIKLPAWATK
jgi:exodeoxyribonuclease VIII